MLFIHKSSPNKQSNPENKEILLTHLIIKGVFNHNYAIDQLIKYSYKKLKSEKRYTLRRPITIFVCPLNDLSVIFCIFAS